ncbi:MAG: O-antigen ligase family protein, partial [Verrucomicrobia bacterium]|nr:O-antigen ligase family protein [Verrucomicrobiota bacterium]
MEPNRNPFAATLDVLVVLLTLLAVALGGSTLPWQQAAIVLGAATLIFISPPRRLLPRWVNALLGGALLCALLPLLPASLAPTEFRQLLTGELRLPLLNTISLQPWLTLEGAGLFFAAMVWGAFLFARHWELSRAVLLEIFAGGVFLLTLGAVLIHFSGFNFPLWHVETGAFGFFPHRNQTATVLGLGGVITLALASRRMHQRHWLALLWGAAYLLIAVSLVLNYSRAGILLFFFGSVVWLVASSHWSQNYFALGMGLTGLFTLVALFVLFGGETWERFRPKETGTGGAAPVLDFRVLVQQDALAMTRESSWHGLGFGNFEPAFPQHRKLSAIEIRAEHPDSDWLWLGLELGLPGTLLLLAAIALLLWPCWPFAKRSQRRLRAAALVGVLLFLLHGVVDVSGHRLGTVWPVLLLLALARNPRDDVPAPPAAPWIFGGLSAALAGLGIIWLAGCFVDVPLRTSGRLVELKERAAAARKF